MTNDKHLRAFITDYSRTIKLTYYHKLPDGKIGVASPLTMHIVEDGAEYEHFATLPKEAAQELMDDLWQCGIRPSEGSGTCTICGRWCSAMT